MEINNLEIQIILKSLQFIRDNGGWGKVEIDIAKGEIVSIKKQILEQHPLKKHE